MSLRSEDLDKAADLSQQSLEIEPDTPSFLDTYGWILYLQENYEEALEFLTLAVENGGNSADIFEHLGFAHKSVGNTEEAISYFQKAIAEQPDLAEKLQPEIDALK
jgi:Tfp pilus assembly protein PilF